MVNPVSTQNHSSASSTTSVSSSNPIGSLKINIDGGSTKKPMSHVRGLSSPGALEELQKALQKLVQEGKDMKKDSSEKNEEKDSLPPPPTSREEGDDEL